MSFSTQRSVMLGTTPGGLPSSVGAAGFINKSAVIQPSGRPSVDWSKSLCKNLVSYWTPYMDIPYGWWIFNKALSNYEMSQMTSNPWQVFAKTQPIWIPA